MTSWRLLWRSLVFYRRTNLAVMLGAAVGAAVLAGALVVGDSVRHSLQRFAVLRLGRVKVTLAAGDRFFRDGLATDLAADFGGPVAPVMQLRGVAWNKDGTARANRVQVLGVDERFWALAPGPPPPVLPDEDGVVLNRYLADRLGAAVGDQVVLRIETPATLPRAVVLASRDQATLAMRWTVRSIASDEAFGRFGLQADQLPPDTAFLSLPRLQRQLDLPGRANLLLAASEVLPEAASGAIRRRWRLADAELELRQLPLVPMEPPDPRGAGAYELRSRRVFVDPTVGPAVEMAARQTTGILTYFVNELRRGDRATPYSMVTAIGQPNALFDQLDDDQILINQWLAVDLEAVPGDSIEMKFFVLGEDRNLVERRAQFTVRAIVPIEGLAADAELTPAFPGLHSAASCRDWKPGIPIDLDRIRPKDEAYWDAYRTTPKAFITLEAGQRMWRNRFGELTAIRFDSVGGSPFPVPGSELEAAGSERETGNAEPGTSFPELLEPAILARLDPAAFGLRFTDARGPAQQAVRQAIGFGGLFLGLSFFLVVASLLLTGLLFVFGVEQRADQTGMLLAVGFPPRQIRRLLLAEGAVLAVGGAVIGTAAGLVYTRLVLWGLSTIWRGAVAGAAVTLHTKTSTLLFGATTGAATALLAMALANRKQAQRPASELLSAGGGSAITCEAYAARCTQPGGWIAAGALIGAALVVYLTKANQIGSGGRAMANAFFATAVLLLIAGLGLCQGLLARLGRPNGSGPLTVGQLGRRNAARRPGRSLTVVGLLACGSFLVVAVGANRLSPPRDATDRDSGTGGFVLYGESALPVLHDLRTPSGRAASRLEELPAVRIVPARVRDGDDASCLNLNRPQTPRLIGIDPDSLAKRGSFRFVELIDPSAAKDPWQLLRPTVDPDAVVPAIADQATVTWGLGLSLGERLSLIDEGGDPFDVQIVGVIENSILQGAVVIAEQAFEQRFPAEAGHRLFLIDAPPQRADSVAGLLTRALEDIGLDLTPSLPRLCAFNAVENTYRAIFGALGGLGLLLGSVGLAMVVLRNMLERRGELAILQATGFTRRALHRMVLAEHGLKVLLGLGCGVAAAAVAVWPTVRHAGGSAPWLVTALTLLAIAANALLWVWLAATLSLRGRLVSALRGE